MSNVVFRVDASIEIGTGHVMRCLTLADELRGAGVTCRFICREHQGNMLEMIRQRKYEAIALPSDFAFKEAEGRPIHAAWLGADWSADATQTLEALGSKVIDWLVVDHYALDVRWERAVRPFCRKLMVVDDLADRPHDCDLLLDQNLGRSADDYYGLVPEAATLLIGPQFALLRPEFARLRPASLARREESTIKHMLVTLGGVDKDNVTGQVLSALECCALPEDLKITVVMGPLAPWLNSVREQSTQMSWSTQVLVGISNMAELMADSDLAIGAAGSTAWERCCLGLPTLILVLADNQREGAVALQNFEAAVVVEYVDAVGALLSQIVMTDDHQKLLSRWSQSAAKVTDGAGVGRVCKYLMVGHA